MDELSEGLGKVIGFFIVIGVIALLIGFPLMWLWNYVMPDIFGLTEITFWQAVAISLLSGSLFKSHNSD